MKTFLAIIGGIVMVPTIIWIVYCFSMSIIWGMKRNSKADELRKDGWWWSIEHEAWVRDRPTGGQEVGYWDVKP